MTKKTNRRTRRKITENRRKTVSARSLRNLKPFPPGVSGNPGGRPAFKKLSEACREELASPLPNDPERTVAQGIAEMLARSALRGSVVAASELADRAEGRARQSVEMTGEKDRLKMLIDSLNQARKNPPPAPSPASSTSDEGGELLH